MDKAFEELRQREFSRLDANGSVYLDYTGSGLYPESLIRAHADCLAKEVLGNPHSRNPTSTVSTRKLERARIRISQFFEADPREYVVIFTQNATGAVHLIAVFNLLITMTIAASYSKVERDSPLKRIMVQLRGVETRQASARIERIHICNHNHPSGTERTDKRPQLIRIRTVQHCHVVTQS